MSAFLRRLLRRKSRLSMQPIKPLTGRQARFHAARFPVRRTALLGVVIDHDGQPLRRDAA